MNTLGLNIVIIPPINGVRKMERKKAKSNPILRFSPSFPIRKQIPMLINKKNNASMLFVFVDEKLYVCVILVIGLV